MANPLYQKHIISINDLSREDLELVLATAAKLKANPQPELLKHKVIASCFFEASTRTRLSFETSMHRLGASVVGFSDSANTSLGKKGETLADTISVISTYVDAIVMRSEVWPYRPLPDPGAGQIQRQPLLLHRPGRAGHAAVHPRYAR